jgi:CheY-like chemotaxis protein
VAADGAEGLARFHPGVHDMVLTDFAMPSLSGVEVIEAVRDRDRGVAVVMLTSSTRDLDRDGQRLRFRLVRKPLDIDTLRRVVSDSLVVPRPF